MFLWFYIKKKIYIPVYIKIYGWISTNQSKLLQAVSQMLLLAFISKVSVKQQYCERQKVVSGRGQCFPRGSQWIKYLNTYLCCCCETTLLTWRGTTEKYILICLVRLNLYSNLNSPQQTSVLPFVRNQTHSEVRSPGETVKGVFDKRPLERSGSGFTDHPKKKQLLWAGNGDVWHRWLYGSSLPGQSQSCSVLTECAYASSHVHTPTEVIIIELDF